MTEANMRNWLRDEEEIPDKGALGKITKERYKGILSKLNKKGGSK
jgi:hypothetical protein